jgi:protein gp37
MSDGTNIEWADATWQPVLGCTRVSPGCQNCYAISVVHRGMSPQHKGLTKVRPKDASRPGVDWNGTVRLQPDKLAEPLRWRKPRRVFVCSLADLFHDAVPFEYIAAVFGVMAACPRHTFLVLTKRPERAREFFSWCHTWEHGEHRTFRFPFAHFADQHGIGCTEEMRRATASHPDHSNRARDLYWPLPNVHLGTSVEDQATADERIPALLQCPAALHWVSAEPLLGPVRMDYAFWATHLHGTPSVRWLVIGGESGPGARKFNIEWARDLMGYAVGSGCAVFVKQLGSRPICVRCSGTGQGDGPGGYCWGCGGADNAAQPMRDRKGGDMSEWPADLRVREVPEC